MASSEKSTKRYDNRHRVLKDGEDQEANGRYRYRYTDPNTGKRQVVYSWKLVPTDKTPPGKRDDLSLREKKNEIQANIKDGLHTQTCNITVDDLWDQYIKLKANIKKNTLICYKTVYETYIRYKIGNCKIAKLRYSDIKLYYQGLIQDGLKVSTISTINNLLNPMFDMAVRDQILRNNPCTNVYSEIRKENPKSKKRYALTISEQEAFKNHLQTKKEKEFYYYIYVFLLGTGCRIGEALGLTWDDIDFENNSISINHQLQYNKTSENEYSYFIETTKTETGTRTVPMFPAVKEVLLQMKEYQKKNDIKSGDVDGYSDFIFVSKNGKLFQRQAINIYFEHSRKRYNKKETEVAEKENREPQLIRHFSAHNLRHTFCTRLCEVENNVGIIMDIMGHSDVSVTMEIYNEVQDHRRLIAYSEIAEKIKI